MATRTERVAVLMDMLLEQGFLPRALSEREAWVLESLLSQPRTLAAVAGLMSQGARNDHPRFRQHRETLQAALAPTLFKAKLDGQFHEEALRMDRIWMAALPAREVEERFWASYGPPNPRPSPAPHPSPVPWPSGAEGRLGGRTVLDHEPQRWNDGMDGRLGDPDPGDRDPSGFP